ncbi:Sodium/hydrogen exchanger 9B1 (Na(+)/H(+) exchanger-like domain-containing protein 1) (NHE domain-containing protein 1) (Sodium/hydrogen exchanger-like domain-containing protein 1) (Solute carrier family 9 subfamily B member 1) (Testis specific sodium-hydrogen exchanger) (MtsNHE) [Durusdinium trenchii]|uniref:Cation/H+ exchanger transmembrane domain-containing protein n=1 Tax=Durusdinium trenchii TaxID=1381693 RepID=A0ABP0MR57_9DINO
MLAAASGGSSILFAARFTRLGALTLILTRAGLAMDLDALRRLRFVVLRLAALPCLSEAATAGLLASWLLDFPIWWAAMLGFVVAAISPAVVVPSLLQLQEQGYGVTAGIPTMVVAAAPLDDVLSIAGFGICLGSNFAETSWLSYARAPLELVLGLGTGLIGSALLVVLTPSSDEEAFELRLLLLLGAGLATAFGLREVGFSGASALAVLVLGAGCARGWGAAAKPVSSSIADLWTRLAQPLLFSLVGASVVVEALDAETVAAGLLIIFLGGLVRFGAVFVALSFRRMKYQEKFFTALAWTPKATVQAAIGALALDEATTLTEQRFGRQLLAVAVLCILVTAPPGAALIAVLGPRLLEKAKDPDLEDAGPDKADDAVPAETMPGEPESK